MQTLVSVFFITLGIGQLIASYQCWRAVSLVGASRWWGYSVGGLLLVLGAGGMIRLTLPEGVWALGWVLLTGPLTLGILFISGSFIKSPPHPDRFFSPNYLEHGGCERLNISDGAEEIPAFLLYPLPEKQTEAAVCLVHGSGDSKSSFKWRLVRALLAEGITVLTIDLPGHGDYQHRLLAYPDCLSTIPAALQFLCAQPGVNRLGLVGISLGGAIALKTMATAEGAIGADVKALVILETPLQIAYNRMLVYREMWATLRAPIMSLFREMSLRQIRQSWQQGAIRSRHSTNEIFDLLNALASIGQINKETPILLVYSRRDPIAPAIFGVRLQAAAPQAELVVVPNASHVTLTLMPTVNRQVAKWVRGHLT